MEEVCAHIRAPFHFAEQLEHERVNDGSAHFLPLPMRKLLSPLKDAVKPIRGHPLFERARSVVARPVRYPPLSPTLRAHMEEYYARDVECLSTLIGRDLRHWHASARKAARSEEHNYELQSLIRISYAVFCWKQKKTTQS